jgi:hypothetical protein
MKPATAEVDTGKFVFAFLVNDRWGYTFDAVCAQWP